VPDQPISRADYLTHRHGALNIARLLTWHAAIVAWAWLGWDYLSWPWYAGLGAILCLAHQREMNDWSHEAVHWNLHPNRRINEVFGNLLASVWFGVPLSTLRWTHLQHHKTEAFFVPDDPDTGALRIASRGDLVRGILSDITGVGAVSHYAGYLLDGLRRPVARSAAPTPRWAMPLLLAGHLALLGFLVWIGRWQIYVLYYATLTTLYRLSHRIRIYGQHLTVNPESRGVCDGSTVSRTVVGGLLDKIIFATDVMLYHHEHHNRPELPYRALRVICQRKHDLNRYVEARRSLWRALWKIA
jgi:fatty acid desaturase